MPIRYKSKSFIRVTSKDGRKKKKKEAFKKARTLIESTYFKAKCRLKKIALNIIAYDIGWTVRKGS